MLIRKLFALAVLLPGLCWFSLWTAFPGEAFPAVTETLEVFVGSASQPATEEVASRFEELTGIRSHLHFGGSGKMLSEMRISGRGDLYFPGSSDFMDLAKREKLVLEGTEKIVVYLIPAINVPAGNPKEIHSLQDLTRSGLKIGLARPDTVSTGLLWAEILEESGLSDRVRKNIKVHTPSIAKTVQLISLNVVDAILGLRVFTYWNPDKIETIPLRPEQVPRIAYIPIAVSSLSKKRETAQLFIDFLISDEGRAIYRRWNYLVTLEEARRFALPGALVGGTWNLPESWK
ncbi:MAG: extracellular solute-binding protein [Proteobacteria bacterium]|nr:extracellular solute-binding protein [Pseudomonadota bacterium]